MNFCTKKEVHIKNEERVYDFFCFRKILIFFEPKYWWKHGICWLLKRSYFEVLASVMGHTVFFSAKKLIEIWYLLGFFELFMK